ncbi:RING finger protein PFF0165c-like [Centruroides sculpturatus]|uniref:RING finger protein PFF0165c-like n=1 Tax=Centruroides sculpturatus TaxID=218467 RepID=UPI000C6E62A6|nr:RING finger protein PFF0165c-like [Centruroides sculpturatus]
MEEVIQNPCKHQIVKTISLEKFLEEFNEWKKAANLILKENIILKEEIKALENKLDAAEKREDLNLKEIAKISSAMNSLHETIGNLIHLEDENKNMKAEISSLNIEKEKIEKLHIENEKIFNQQIQELTENFNSDIKNIKEENEENKKNIHSMYEKKLKERDDELNAINTKFTKQIKEKTDSIAKLELEYEGKITKLKDQLLKSTKLTNSETNNIQEIYRQKQQQMKQKYETTISMLNEELNKLKNQTSTKICNSNLTDELKQNTSSESKSINIKSIAKILNNGIVSNGNPTKNTMENKGNAKSLSKKRKLFQPDKSYL